MIAQQQIGPICIALQFPYMTKMTNVSCNVLNPMHSKLPKQNFDQTSTGSVTHDVFDWYKAYISHATAGLIEILFSIYTINQAEMGKVYFILSENLPVIQHTYATSNCSLIWSIPLLFKKNV